MSTLTFKLPVSVDVNDSDETIAEKAKEHRSTAIRKCGEAAAARLWDIASKSKLGKPKGSKAAFIRSAGAQAVRTASSKKLQEAEDSLFAQMKAYRESLK